MSKYRKTDGSGIEYNTMGEAVDAFCKGKSCETCPMDKMVGDDIGMITCCDWAVFHQAEAAEMMGLKIVEEKPNGETRGPGTIPNVVNAKVCGEWAAKNLDRALALTGIEAVEVETAEMIPPECVKEVRLDEQAVTAEKTKAEPGAPNVRRHWDICKELNVLYERKNHDYGDSFHQSFEEEGMAMARIRLGDKLSRFKTLTRNGGQQVADESIRDTLIDLANYAIMTVMEMEDDSNG